tara:strand:- start:894 stop:1352 length:459 start_codon:yes stop_codon:yes gene_type:complete
LLSLISTLSYFISTTGFISSSDENTYLKIYLSRLFKIEGFKGLAFQYDNIFYHIKDIDEKNIQEYIIVRIRTLEHWCCRLENDRIKNCRETFEKCNDDEKRFEECVFNQVEETYDCPQGVEIPKKTDINIEPEPQLEPEPQPEPQTEPLISP